MAIAYQYGLDGYFAGAVEDHGLLPNNATYALPMECEGSIPRWNGHTWEQVENHKGEQGYKHGEPFTMTDYGPYPEGWSTSPPPPTPDERREALFAVIRARLDDFARTRDYDSIMSAATHATSAVPKFRTEGQYAVEARDATWNAAYALLDAVLSGKRSMPSAEDLEAELPPLVWPEA